VSDYLEGGVDGLSVEPGEQNGPPGGGQEDLRGAVCLWDEGGQGQLGFQQRSRYSSLLQFPAGSIASWYI
jgi:hypothetical protein